MIGRIRPYEVIGGSTIKLTWVSTGAIAGSIECNLRDKDDVIINSYNVVSSGNGMYYAVVAHPNSAQWVVNEWRASINANTYVDRQFGRIIGMEVD